MFVAVACNDGDVVSKLAGCDDEGGGRLAGRLGAGAMSKGGG